MMFLYYEEIIGTGRARLGTVKFLRKGGGEEDGSRKIDPGRLVSKGYGEKKPVATNDTDEGRHNRHRWRYRHQ